MNPLEWAGLVVAGAAGAVARSLVIASGVGLRFPWATLAVNTGGSFVLGLLTGAGGPTRLVLGTGFCGAYTTFSTFAVEADRLPARPAAGYVALTLVAGLAAAAAGMALAPLPS